MTLAKYRPQGTVMSPFNDFVNEFFGRDITQLLGSDEMKRTMPSVNITERAEDYKLEMLAPGYERQDLKMNVEDEVLTISAEHKSEQSKENERYTRREFSRSSFSRSFRLPEGTQHDAIKAEYTNGVLSVIIPKVAPRKPSVREIQIG
ncbi:MAG: Hsp20/alpha crystallin family protein [Flavobacteriales bacterium]|nr:Hsp20/alpha crystallin family protein [Flavobacteriales bacterium]